MGKKKFGYWQLCPRCGGNGMIHNPNMNTTASQLFVTCDVCHGNKIIARPLLNSEQEDERSVATEADSSNADGEINPETGKPYFSDINPEKFNKHFGTDFTGGEKEK